MKIYKLNCSSCGAPISIPDNIDFINCSSCGSFLGVERGEGYVALKLAEKLARAIEDSGKGTQDVIREGTQVTRSELQRLQLSQEIGSLQLQLSNTQAEIRGLLRAPSSGTVITQIKSLRIQECKTMDHIRKLTIEMAALGPQDPISVIKNLEGEIKWIESEIEVLELINDSINNVAIRKLNERLNDHLKTIHTIKVQQLKGQFESFQVKDLPINDHTAASKLLAVMAFEETTLRQNKHLPEVKEIMKELASRQKTLTDAWNKMEHARLTSNMSVSMFSLDFENLDSVKEYLQRIENDLVTLGNSDGNSVAKALENKLLEEKRRAQKQARSLEKKAQKDVAKAARPSKENIWIAMLAGITAVFAGFAAVIGGLFANRSASTRATTARWQGGDDQIIIEPVPPSVPTYDTIDKKSTGISCMLGLFVMIAVAFASTPILIAIFPETNSTGENSVGAMFLALAIAVILGSQVFLRRAAPNTIIRGFWRLPDIKVVPGKIKSGTARELDVMALMGIFTCLIIWSLSMALSGFTSTPDSDISVLFFVLGFFLGPFLGIVVATRTILKRGQAE